MSNVTPTGISLPDPSRIAGALKGALTGVGGTAAGQAVISSLPGASTLDNFTKIGQTLSDPGIWKRIGVIALGVWLVWIGVIFLLAQSRVVRESVGAGVGALSKGVIK